MAGRGGNLDVLFPSRKSHNLEMIRILTAPFRQNTRLRNVHLIPDDTNINGRILNFFSYRSISNRLVSVVKIFFFGRISASKAIFN